MTTDVTPVLPVSPENVTNEELTNATANADTVPPQSPPPVSPHLMNSLAELRKLSDALFTFYRRYDELTNHLDFIKTAIDSKLPDHLNLLALTLTPILPILQSSLKPSLPEPESVNLSIPEPVNVDVEPNNITNSESKLESPDDDQKLNLESKQTESGVESEKPERSELEKLCENMCGKGLRRYIASNLVDSSKVRKEVPSALKLAENPYKLVLECVGRFYLQGSRAYTKERPVIEVRRASVLVLECFLVMEIGDVEIDKEVEKQAAEAAVDWRKRIMSEGGIDKAAEIDARGLLLLISGFGIPSVFKDEDIRDLMMATRVRRISSALRRSRFLVPKIPAIIELMLKNNLDIEAADVAYSFRLEDKCSPKKILTTFVKQTIKSKMHGSSEEVKTAKKKQLADLKSVIKCLEAHEINPSDLLPDSKISEKITSLEKEITELEKKIKEKAAVKRKADEAESKKLRSEDVKRSRYTGHTSVHHISPARHGHGTTSYSGLGITNNLLDERLRGSNINGYSASPSVPHGLRPEDITGLSAGVVNTNPYARVYGQRPEVYPAGQMVSQGHGQLYELRGDVGLNERLITQAYAGQSQSYAAAPSPSERLLSQAYAGPGQTYASQLPSSGLTTLYRSSQPQSSLEGFAGLPHPSSSAGHWTRGSGSGSNLYQFADSVLESETGGNRGVGGNLPPVLPAHRSSFLY